MWDGSIPVLEGFSTSCGKANGCRGAPYSLLYNSVEIGSAQHDEFPKPHGSHGRELTHYRYNLVMFTCQSFYHFSQITVSVLYFLSKILVPTLFFAALTGAEKKVVNIHLLGTTITREPCALSCCFTVLSACLADAPDMSLELAPGHHIRHYWLALTASKNVFLTSWFSDSTSTASSSHSPYPKPRHRVSRWKMVESVATCIARD